VRKILKGIGLKVRAKTFSVALKMKISVRREKNLCEK